MQRYFCNQDSDLFTLSRDDSYHITKVMRYNIGTKIEIVCNNTLYCNLNHSNIIGTRLLFEQI